MRYYVYKDAQIMGPFTREDLSQVQGVSADSLVCAEASLGTKDSEWRPAVETDDLAGLFAPRAALAAAPAIDLGSAPPDLVQRLSEGFGYAGEWVSGAFEDPQFFREWGALVDSATQRSDELERAQARAAALESALTELEEKLGRYERQQNEILDRLNDKDRALGEKERVIETLQSKLPELERALRSTQDELRRARERFADPPAAPSAAAAPPPVPAPLPAAPAPVEPPLAQLPSEVEVRRVEVEPATEAKPPIEMPSVELQPAIDLAAPSVPAEAAAPPADPSPAPLAMEPERLELTSLAPVEPASAAAPEPAAPEPAPLALASEGRLASSVLVPQGIDFIPPTPPAAVPERRPAAAEPPVPLEPPAPVAPPTAVEPAPEPVLFSTRPAAPPATFVERQPAADAPAAVSAEPPAPLIDLGAEPGPVVPAESAAAGPPPETWGMSAATPAPVTGGAPFDTPRTAIHSLGEPVGNVPLPISESLATPSPEPVAAPASPLPAAAPAGVERAPTPPAKDGAETRRRRHSRTFLIALSAAFVGLLVTGVFFLKDPKEVILLFTMGPRKRTPAVDPEQLMGPAPTSLSQLRPLAAAPTPSTATAAPLFPLPASSTPAPAGAAPAAAPVATAPAAPPAAAAPGPGRDFIADTSLAAIDFAKKYKLGGGRRSVGQWLQFSFLAPGNEEEWSAGAVEANVYLVSYRAFRGGRAAKQEPITYLFEVDLQKKTMTGRNPAARELLAGGPPRAARRPAKRARKSRPAVTKPAGDTLIGDNVDQLPLPDTSSAEPASGEAGGLQDSNPQLPGAPADAPPSL